MFKFLTAFFVAIVLTACATSGTKFNMADVDAMKPGQTTIADAKAVLGPPANQVNKADGTMGLVWVYSHVNPTNAQSRSVGILFDKDGKMIRVVTKGEQQTR